MKPYSPSGRSSLPVTRADLVSRAPTSGNLSINGVIGIGHLHSETPAARWVALRCFLVDVGSVDAPTQRCEQLRVCKEITDALWRERRGGRWEAPRRRRCRCASSRSGNKADAPAPPRPCGLGSAATLALLLAPYIPQRVCAPLAPSQRTWGPQQSVSVISLQTLTYPEFRTHNLVRRGTTGVGGQNLVRPCRG